MSTKKIKGQYLNRSTFLDDKGYECVRFFKGQVYEWGRVLKGLACTGVPKLPLSYPPSPPPHEGLPLVLTGMAQRKFHQEKHAYIIFYPLKTPLLYSKNGGFTGVYIIFLISAQKHRLWVLVRTAILRRFLTSTTIYVFEQKYEKYQNFLSEKLFSFFGGEMFNIFE